MYIYQKKFVNLRFKREIIMLDKIMALREEINAAIASDMEAVEQLRIKYLSKKGLVSSLMADFRSVPADQKREVGQKINELKTFATEKINSLRDAFLLKDLLQGQTASVRIPGGQGLQMKGQRVRHRLIPRPGRRP